MFSKPQNKFMKGSLFSELGILGEADLWARDSGHHPESLQSIPLVGSPALLR